jgi:hypothetical protein
MCILISHATYIIIGVRVDSRLQLNSALKGGIIRVLARNNRLNGRKHFALISGQLSVSYALKLFKKLKLLRRSDVFNYAKKYAKWPILALVA